MAILNKEVREQVANRLSKEMSGKVNLMFFFDKSQSRCPLCGAAADLLKELSEIDNRIALTTYDMESNPKEAKFLGVDKVPALVIGGKKIYNVLYFGMPSGYEFASLLEDIIDASKGTTDLSEETKRKIRAIDKKVDIKVFVTPTCPYCPKAVRIAHQFAMENGNIRSSMIEAQEFMELSRQYEVMGVPRIVINDTIALEGAQPEEVFANRVVEASSK